MFYVWLAIAIGLAILEMATVNLVSIWYIISSILAMIVSLFTDNIVIQMAVFVLGGTVFLILTKKLFDCKQNGGLPMKIVILDGHALNPGDLSWDFLRQFGKVTVYPRTPAELAAARIGDADIVLLNKIPITAATLEACPNLKLICVLATGYNVVDCTAAKERGIPVCNVPDYGTAAVAQFTFALLLELCPHVGHQAQTVRQ